MQENAEVQRNQLVPPKNKHRQQKIKGTNWATSANFPRL